jgi:cytochrome b561
MTTTNTPFRYARLLVVLHWLMFALFIVVYAAMEFRVLYEKGMPEREFMKSLPFMGWMMLSAAGKPIPFLACHCLR